MKVRSFFTLGVLLVMLSLGPVSSAHRAHAAATPWVVNTLADEQDGSCSDGSCSLRDAIALAASGDTVTFSVVGTILLSLGGLTVDKDLTIGGPGASSLTVDGSGLYQVFYIRAGVAVTLSGLTVTHGYSSYGGGISNEGTLALDQCILADNVAAVSGGGLNNRGTATVSRSTFSGNQAHWGGGIKNENGVLSVTNCTFTGNSAGYRGGGIDSGSSSILDVTNSTFLGNSAYVGGGIGNPSSVSTAENVLMAGNAGGDCNGAFAPGSTNNLATDGTCSPGFTQASPEQLALGDLTGNPAYYPLQFGSVAIDAGSNDGCPALDEPGNPRPLDGNGDGVAVCDVGAFEAPSVTFDHAVYLPLIMRNYP